jgi:hypothetical protein
MQIIIISGMSGAGKSSAVKAMEDAGFYCVDNMPPQLIPAFAEICRQSGGEIEKVALVVDMRSGTLFKQLFGALDEISGKNIGYEILFLEANNEVLISRYKQTRRSHPLSPDGGVTEGIAKERELIADVRARANYIIDTSSLTPLQLKEEVNANIPVNFQQNNIAWQEPPISIEPTQSFVSLNKDNRGIALFPQGVREYEVIDNHALRLTLFRTYSFMGKENLIYRPGRASGERIIETPDAELLKPLDFSFGFMSFSQSFNNSLIANYAKEYNTPVIAKEYAEFLNGRLIFSEMEKEGQEEKEYSLFTTENKLIVSAIKKAEERNGYIIRLFNGQYHEDVSDVLHFNKKVVNAYYTDLKEQKVEDISFESSRIPIKSLSHCQFITVYVETE